MYFWWIKDVIFHTVDIYGQKGYLRTLIYVYSCFKKTVNIKYSSEVLSFPIFGGKRGAWFCKKIPFTPWGFQNAFDLHVLFFLPVKQVYGWLLQHYFGPRKSLQTVTPGHVKKKTQKTSAQPAAVCGGLLVEGAKEVTVAGCGVEAVWRQHPPWAAVVDTQPYICLHEGSCLCGATRSRVCWITSDA